MPRRNRPVEFWLEQAIAWAERMDQHIGDVSINEFMADAKAIDAVSWCISCIGEACGKIIEIDPDFERTHDGIELTAAYSARNRYVHGYFDLDAEQIWHTARNDVPLLAANARRFVNPGE